MVNLEVSRGELQIITKIMLRAASMLNLELLGSDRLSLSMDLTACHANECPLDLDGLLLANDLDFTHDVCGIMRHIDRKTGTLTNCFLPRYAKRES
jgi:hypothetical protein